MTPVFSLPCVPTMPSAPFRPVQQTANFEAIFTVSSGPFATTSDTPVVSVEPIRPHPVVQENQATNVAASNADIDAAIRPLLASFASEPSSVAISVVSTTTANEQVSGPDVEKDQDQPVQPECVDAVNAAPVFIPAPTQIPASVFSPLAPAVSPASPKVTEPKGGAPVMEPDVQIGAHTQAAPVQTISTRQNITRVLQQRTQDASLPVNQAGAAPIAELAALFAATPVESGSVTGTGFHTIMTDRIAETSVRPMSDASAVVADRALDFARGSLWLDQLAGDIAAVQDKDCDLSFRLVPAQLGQLDVKIANSDSGMQLNFNTQSEAAAQIISSAQSRLVEELKAQGVRVAGSEVNAGSGQQSFAQQNGQSARAAAITEFERPSSDFPESTSQNEPQNGRFA